jgi:two-component system, chemotaxis family, response regulator WspF
MKIGIVNDLPIAVASLRRALAASRSHQVVWVAHDGAEAVRACMSQTPDLVLMDLIMAGMDGVEATRRIMASTPCAILIVTASVGANSWRAYEAMSHGALDAVDTPVFRAGDGLNGAAALLSKIDTIARLIGDGIATAAGEERQHGRMLAGVGGDRLLAIGASAGGPGALATVLSRLPRGFPAAIVMVQHVDQEFAPGMAKWLAQQTDLPVEIVRSGEPPVAGTALLASTNDHLVLTRSRRLDYSPDPLSYVYRPSVDVFFESVCQHWSGEAVGVLLTGMGRDGALGLRAMRNKGYHTIAQDQASSAVYGMPKAAAALDAAVEILSLEQIGPRLLELVCK